MDYPKGTRLLCCLSVSRMKDAEAAMLGSCRGDDALVARSDFGIEYFEGDRVHLMMKLGNVSKLFPASLKEVLEDGGELEEGVEVVAEPNNLVVCSL